jgi:hypothetical protein
MKGTIPQGRALLLAILLLTGCGKNGVVVITPLNQYTKENIISKAEYYCSKYGMLISELRSDEQAWQRLIDDVIREYVYEDLSKLHAEEINNAGIPELNEKEIRDKYETLLFSQKQYFTEKKEIVSAAIKHPRDTIVYYPPGLKWVKLFTVPYKAEIRGRAAILLNEGKQNEYKNYIEEADGQIITLIQEIKKKLLNGENFDFLASEYGEVSMNLLYSEDNELFPAQAAALRALQNPGDIAEYSIYQGHVFMILDKLPDYIEVPYEEIKEEIASAILKNKIIIQHDRLMKKLYEEAIAAGSVKIKKKNVKELNG